MKKRFVSRWSRDTNILARVVTGVLPTPEGLLQRQRMAELQAVEAFAKGYATQTDLWTLCDVVNVSSTFANTGVGPEVEPHAEKARDALSDAIRRHTATGRYGLDGPGLQAVRELLEWHELQRTAVDWATYTRAIEKTGQHIRSTQAKWKQYA